MSIIQTIREKGAVITIALMAIALIGFMLMDSSSTGALGGSNTSTIGSVNGEEIKYADFNEKVEQMEQQNPNLGTSQRNMVMQRVWDQMIAEKLVEEQFNKLGLTFTPREMSAIMFSEDAPQTLKQAFTNPETGQYDIGQAKQWWSQTKQNRNEEQRNAIIAQVIDPLRLSTLYSKYTSMIAASIYQPKWLAKQQQEAENKFALLSYVAIPYQTINDSTIKVTDADIENYLQNHKEQYKQEPGIRVSYVAFSAAANAADSARIKQSLADLKQEFVADSNAKFFLGRNGSVVPYSEIFVPVSKMQMPFKDSIKALPVGGVFGPYQDGSNYVLAKKIAVKPMPDSISARHILIGTTNPQTQQPIMADSTAKRIADSIATAIAGGADFNTLEAKYSTDEAAKLKNGVMTFDIMTIQSDGFAEEFADFLLNKKGETKKVVKTQFGYHYIEILDKIGMETAYNIAYMASEIAPSDKTINTANTAAIKLSGNTGSKAFNEYVSKNGLSKIDVPNVVKENDFQLGRYQDARSLIKWAYEAREGDVSEPFSIDDDFVVAILAGRIKDGVPDVVTARPMVESIIRNNKKAEEIKKKLNNPATLEAAAKVYKKEVLQTSADSTLTFEAQIINGIGNEPKIAGAAFNEEYQKKVSPPIPGNTGVFVIKVNSVAKKAPLDSLAIAQQKANYLNGVIQSALSKSFESLKKIANIEDNRSTFF